MWGGISPHQLFNLILYRTFKIRFSIQEVNSKIFRKILSKSKVKQSVAANVFELFWMAHLAYNECFLYYSKPFILNIKFYIYVNSIAWADENQLNYLNVRFLSEMRVINSRWVIFNIQEWALFKSKSTCLKKNIIEIIEIIILSRNMLILDECKH